MGAETPGLEGSVEQAEAMARVASPARVETRDLAVCLHRGAAGVQAGAEKAGSAAKEETPELVA